MIQVNWLAILLCGVTYEVVGALWYSPALFAKPWQKLTGVKMGGSAKDLPIMMAYSFIASLIMAYVLAVVLKMMGGAGIANGLRGAFWTWLGFIATSMFINGIYQKKSYTLMAIDAGFFLVDLLLFGVILSVMH